MCLYVSPGITDHWVSRVCIFYPGTSGHRVLRILCRTLKELIIGCGVPVYISPGTIDR